MANICKEHQLRNNYLNAHINILTFKYFNYQSFMWLINSSIGRKVVMSVTGIALILFLTFHMSMNVVALFSGEAYNMICEL